MILNANFYLEGFMLALNNAESLKTIAELSAKKKQFGIACSLNVLAAEEAVKASFIISKHYNPDENIRNWDDIFRKHLIKHEHLKGLVAFYYLQYRRYKIDLNVEQWLRIAELSSESNSKEENKFALSLLYEAEEYIKRFEQNGITYEEIAIWLSNANLDKNNGLYVDLKGNDWVSPKSFTKEKFLRESKYCEIIIFSVNEIAKMFFDVKRWKEKDKSEIDDNRE